jgi:hypothetical protein
VVLAPGDTTESAGKLLFPPLLPQSACASAPCPVKTEQSPRRERQKARVRHGQKKGRCRDLPAGAAGGAASVFVGSVAGAVTVEASGLASSLAGVGFLGSFFLKSVLSRAFRLLRASGAAGRDGCQHAGNMGGLPVAGGGGEEKSRQQQRRKGSLAVERAAFAHRRRRTEWGVG